jgi:arginine utilization regulatory protein
MKKCDLSEIILQNILHHTDIGVHVIDINEETVVYNEVMAKLEGLDREYVINKELLDVFPSLDKETSTLLKVMSSGCPILNRAQTYLNYKGQKITTVNSTLPLKYKDEIVGALEIAKNVTNIKKLSDQLFDLQNELIVSKAENKNKTIKKYTFKDIIGNNRGIKKAVDIGRKASKSFSSVLIYGETGSGKELFAQSIHYDGPRKNKPFVAENCAAIPDSLLEGILFGTEKGGFTGAVNRPGIFEQANGGTLLLDEINSMSLPLQAKLLRVLQEGYIRRVGGIKNIPVDVKIIATTNEDPMESIKKGTLREDLYYRLNVICINIPPLRKRKDDIPLLCDYFIEKYNHELKKDIWMISDDIMDIFNDYDWPGNVRELENAIESAMNYILDDEHVLRKEHFVSCPHIFKNKSKNMDILDLIDDEVPLPDVIENIEKKMILNSLLESNYNITKAAERLGIKRQTLQHKIKKYDI